jgi:hypothetical protein
MTTTRAPYKTRRWTDEEDDTLRSLVQSGRDARLIGIELKRSFMGVQARVKKLKMNLAPEQRRIYSEGNLWRWAVKTDPSER